MIYFITFNDQPSGIYQSQVVGVISLLQKLSGKPMKLIAFFPRQSYFKNRDYLREQKVPFIAIPMIFGITRWKWYRLFMLLFIRRGASAVCRGPISACLAKGFFSKVVYDGRAAVKAEVEEYDVTSGNLALGADLARCERSAILDSNFRIAVSERLVEYWKREFSYSGNEHVIIPSTLTYAAADAGPFTDEFSADPSEVRVVYSGSTSGWQSFDLVVKLLDELMAKQENVQIIFLTTENIAIDDLIAKYPRRCCRRFISHDDVYYVLSGCDYGILLRDSKVTNQVASPVKFAEYLHAGLQILITPGLGDFSDLVEKVGCGLIVKDEIPFLPKPTTERKFENHKLSIDYFSKDSSRMLEVYKTLLHSLE
ncbi:MAG: hypothetical protein SGI87_08630 [Flavobacteriales bacterium]|nr:hypothetical protein [Flavobacteriales bacterium]